MWSWCSFDQSMVRRSCPQDLLHVVCTLGNADCSHEQETRLLIKVFALSVTHTSASSVLQVFLFISLFWGLWGPFFLSDSLCVSEMCQRNDYKAPTRKNTAHSYRCYQVWLCFLSAEPTQSSRMGLSQTRTYNIIKAPHQREGNWDSSAGVLASPDLCQTALKDRSDLI